MATAELNEAIEQRLTVLRRKWQELVGWRGAGLVLWGTLLPLSLVLLCDLFVELPAAVRGLALVASLVCGFWMGVWGWLRPFHRGVTRDDLARWLESADPRFEERLRTCLSLDARMSSTSRAVRVMQRQVQRETASILNDISPDEGLPVGNSYRLIGSALFLLALTLAPAIVWPHGYGLGLQRLTAPWGNWGWGRNDRLEILNSDFLIIRGQDLLVRAVAHRWSDPSLRPAYVDLHWHQAGEQGGDQRRMVWSEVEGTYTATIPRVSLVTHLRITAPAAASSTVTVTPVDPPKLTSLEALVDPPAYTGLPSSRRTVEGELEVPAGSRITWLAEWDRPCRDAQVEGSAVQGVFQSPAPQGRGDSTTGVQLKLSTLASVAGEFTLSWSTPEGLKTRDHPRQLRLLVDRPPFIRREGSSSLKIRPGERHVLEGVANDDYGLTQAEIVADVDGQRRAVLPLELKGSDSRQQTWASTVDLQELDAKPGQTISLRVRVLDNRGQPGPQETWSDAQILVVQSSAPASLTRALAGQTESARQRLQELLENVVAEKRDLHDVHQKVAAATVRQKDAAQDQKLEELSQRHDGLQQNFADWQNRLPEGADWEKISQEAEKVAKGELTAAAEKLKQAREADARDSITRQSEALEQLAHAERSLQALDDQIRNLQNRGESLSKLADLANRSERLAEQMAARDPQQPPVPGEPMRGDSPESIGEDLAREIAADPNLRAAMEAARQQEVARRLEVLTRLLNEEQASAALQEFQAARQPVSALRERNAPGVELADQNAGAKPDRADNGDADFERGQALAEQTREMANATSQQRQDAGEAVAADKKPPEAAEDSASSPAPDRLADATERGEFAQAAELAREMARNDQSSEEPADLAEQMGELIRSERAQQGAQAAAETRRALEARELVREMQAQQPGEEKGGIQELERATEAMTLAAQSLQEADPQQAAEQTRLATEELARACEACRAASSKAGNGSSREGIPSSSDPANPQMAELGQALSDAGQKVAAAGQAGSGAQPNAGSAAPPNEADASVGGKATQPSQLLQEAAQALRRAAQSANGQERTLLANEEGQAAGRDSPGGQPLAGVPGSEAAASLEGSPMLPTSGEMRNWGRLMGTLRTDRLDGGRAIVFPEYRDQIQRYFQTIAQPTTATPSSTAGAGR